MSSEATAPMHEIKPAAPTPFEKLQAEYNQTCAEYGHAKAQMLVLEKQLAQLEVRLEKIRNKASNVSKEDQTKEGELKNGTES